MIFFKCITIFNLKIVKEITIFLFYKLQEVIAFKYSYGCFKLILVNL